MTDKNIPMTKFAFDALSRQKEELDLIVNYQGKSSAEKQREANLARRDLLEVSKLLEQGYIRDFSEKNAAMVQIGATVLIENMHSGDKREYRIMTRTTADPLNGVLSNESPLAQKILGLYLKNTFKFRDSTGHEDSYKIINIE